MTFELSRVDEPSWPGEEGLWQIRVPGVKRRAILYPAMRDDVWYVRLDPVFRVEQEAFLKARHGRDRATRSLWVTVDGFLSAQLRALELLGEEKR